MRRGKGRGRAPEPPREPKTPRAGELNAFHLQLAMLAFHVFCAKRNETRQRCFPHPTFVFAKVGDTPPMDGQVAVPPGDEPVGDYQPDNQLGLYPDSVLHPSTPCDQDATPYYERKSPEHTDAVQEVTGSGVEEVPGSGVEEVPGSSVEEVPGSGVEEVPASPSHDSKEVPGSGVEEVPAPSGGKAPSHDSEEDVEEHEPPPHVE